MKTVDEIKEAFRKIGIIPVVVLDDEEQAEPLAEALLRGGLPAAEVTFRTDAAAASIRRMKEKYPELLVGAGTVLTREQVDRAVDAGAEFLVSPGLNPDIVKYAMEKGVPFTPGTQTPSEIEQAMALGLDFVKFFPAEPSGGLNMIKAVAAAYTKLSFMPTGGINAKNVGDYLAYDRIVACGGSWMVKKDLINAGDFAEIERLVAEAAALVKR
ncbi:MAG: bifunctional 4-hydroxy-2-oxoglutarate aldolase/2-dehydro-3-deoxy-phosphogluconate aldolase [Eubacterium sp.]|nr:bifunctional 4-hydroxy-2-oxoglutarate aldolase/2-dehydro-3-deoxy-phosphogluconate aldolase [Eubacterium sp.]